jgi:hypothetical protein
LGGEFAYFPSIARISFGTHSKIVSALLLAIDYIAKKVDQNVCIKNEQHGTQHGTQNERVVAVPNDSSRAMAIVTYHNATITATTTSC